MNRVLCAAVNYISEHTSLWETYWKDFISTKFNISLSDDVLTLDLITLTVIEPLTGFPPTKRIVALHCMANDKELCKLISTLRPLQQLQKDTKAILQPVTEHSNPLRPEEILKLEVKKNPNNIQNKKTLYQFILDSLFLSFANACQKYGRSEQDAGNKELLIWHKAHRDVVR